MKDGYRRFLIITIVILSSFLIVTVARKLNESTGLLEFINHTGPDFTEEKIKNVTLADGPIIERKDIELLAQLNNEYSRISSAVMPSVVSINTAGTKNAHIRDRFGRVQTQTSNTSGQGSGVIVSEEGHIITNYHVISNMQEIHVQLANGITHEVSIIGTDSSLDIAVLKIKAEGPFPALPFGDSDEVREGNIVLAFGNPFGIGKSITQGMISARERSISDLQGELFQSSAAINPGYSGGPLVNIYGEIIGINSNIYKNDEKSPNSQGISFSIPSNIVQRTFINICERGKPIRGFLGVASQPLVDDMQKKLGYTKEYGILVSNVGPGTPAAKAGIQPEDIILNFDGRAVRDAKHLRGIIERSEIGKPYKVLIWRDKAQKELEVTIEEFNKELAIIPAASEISKTERILLNVGIEVTFLNNTHRRQGIMGVRVTRVFDDSLAYGLIQPNDIIYQVNQYRINQPNEFYSIIEMSAPKQSTECFVLRAGQVLPEPIIIPQLKEE
ncbi:trypsin-like peptidase domain-containing protein [Rubritalea spongiae]|uniref:Trypsin-like peptidase domain-containing protein n=1 Tax=Rubritalea spongiae TaxID=430797 RepID=A0ABW5E200_9BACT